MNSRALSLTSGILRLAAICAAFTLLLPRGAAAVVRPPEEWFDSPAKHEQWKQMWPILNELEFGKHEPLLGDPDESAQLIGGHLGQSTEQLAAELGLEPDSVDVLSEDRNFDGRLDQFDLLELGYQVQPASKRASTAPPTGVNQICVLRTDFTDTNANYGLYTTGYFNERLFSEGTAPLPSFNDYYQEVSYGMLEIGGQVSTGGPGGDGWYKASNTKAWYHASWSRAPLLVAETIAAADATTDFSQFDVDGDGYVDTLCLYYPGPVMWNGGLHPHRNSGLNIHVDGVIIDSYFLSVVDSSNPSWLMVITAHEYGHILGLPDLYDVNGGSAGMGYWSLMAYNYDNDQKPPSPDPWCKTQLGWVTPEVVTENLDNYSLENYQDSGKVLKVWTNGKQESQYFLVANYRKKKTDANRPGEGLLVLHIDDTIGGGDQDNANEDRKHVDVEAANGYSTATKDTATPKDELDDGSNGSGPNLWYSGNADPDYTGFFNDTSNPHSRNYPSPGGNTFIQLSEISVPGNFMTLDVTVKTADAPQVTITAPAEASTVTGDSTIDVDVTPGSGRTILRVEFFCNGAYLGTDSSAPYSLTFDSRSIYEGSREIKAIAYDDAGDANNATEEIGIDTLGVTVDNTGISVPYLDNLESGIGKFAVYDPSGPRRWESKNVGSSGSFSAGIGSSNGYGFNEHDSLVSLQLDLTGATHPICRFKQRYKVANGENTVKVFATSDNGATLDMLSSNTGSNLSWNPISVDLQSYVGQEVFLVFKLDSTSLNDMSGTEAGWWIDDFELKELSSPPQILTITPGAGSTLTGVQTVSVTATDDEGVAAVDFLLNGNDKVFTDYSAPFEYNLNSDWLFNGAATFKAVAYDADFQSAEATVSWTMDNPGVNLPWSPDLNADPGISWRIKDDGGPAIWHYGSNFGYNPSGGMRCCIPNTNSYGDGEADWFISPTLDIASITKPGVGYLHKYDFEVTGGVQYDFGYAFLTTNLNTWTQLAQYGGQFGTPVWQANGHRLDAYLGQKVKLAWRMNSDVGVVRKGWWLDQPLVEPAPQISGFDKSRVVRGQPLVISGTGFGAGPGNTILRRVTFGGVVATVTNWTDTSITATVPSGAPSDSSVVVIRHGIPSDGVNVKVVLPAPTLTGVGQL